MEYVEEFTQLFRLATRARLRTHQKVGVLLSGGLDSSYVAAVAALEGARLVAITGYAAQTTGMDERPFAKLIVQHLGIEWQTVDLSDCWSLSRRWLPDEVFDEAIHAPQSASHICLAQAARSLGVGVLLSGDGGDERMLERPGVLADAIKHGAFGYAWQHARTGCRSMHAVRRLVRSCYRQAAPFRIQDGIARLRHRANRPEYTPFVRWQSGWVDRAQARRALIWNPRQALRQEWQQYWQEDYPALRWRERHALAPNGIDLRAPFNDLRIVELMASTPEWVKRFQGRPKDLLRQAEYPILPAVIPDRDDNGEYGALLHAGVATHEQDRVCQGIEQLCRFPGLHAGSVKEEVQRWISTGEGQWAPSWRAMTVGLWLACSGVDVPAPGEAADAA